MLLQLVANCQGCSCHGNASRAQLLGDGIPCNVRGLNVSEAEQGRPAEAEMEHIYNSRLVSRGKRVFQKEMQPSVIIR